MRRIHSQPRVRSHAEPVEPRADARWLERRIRCAITSGMVSTATSTDAGGSIGIPASYCGLVGLKPTNGLVPRDPAARAMDWIDLTTDGPMGSTVDDVRLQLRALSDAASVGASVQQSLKPRRTSRLLVLKRWTSRVPLPNEDATLFGEAVTHLCSITGLDPEPMAASELFPGIEVGDDWALVAAPELLSIVGGRDSLELVRDRLHPTTAAFAGWGAEIGIDAYLGARRRRMVLADLLEDTLGHGGVIVSPTMCGDAVAAEGPPEPGSEIGLYDNVLAPNLTGFPAISLPAGLRANGVPLGVQLVAPPYHEGMLLDLAESWEEARPWQSVAPGYGPLIT